LRGYRCRFKINTANGVPDYPLPLSHTHTPYQTILSLSLSHTLYWCRFNINTANAVPGFTDFHRHTSKAFTHAWFMDGGATAGQARQRLEAEQGYDDAPNEAAQHAREATQHARVATQQPYTEAPSHSPYTEAPSHSAHSLQAQQVDVGKLCVVLTGHYELCVQGLGYRV